MFAPLRAGVRRDSAGAIAPKDAKCFAARHQGGPAGCELTLYPAKYFCNAACSDPMADKHHTRTYRALRGSKRSKTRCKGAARYRVARITDIGPGESRKFLMPIHGAEEECFVINFEGTFYAYVNRCRHIPMALDWVDNQFFAEEGRYLMCQTHNAYYEPVTGECIAGPPSACGKMLYRVELTIVDDAIYATPPEQQFDDD
ncbi:MAG TPA: Rieske 2Fe-2S domain-containing protein [Candidatus Binataceae bacterium]|nr:Rieske 2Fe-2S domain-containing protein [Candidatus Binataceae bacterium]